MASATRISPNDFTLQSYEGKDENLITTFEVDTRLTSQSCVEFFVYDNNKNLLFSEENYTNYQVEYDSKSDNPDNLNSFTISPSNDVTDEGFNEGTYIAYYNFFTKRIGDPLSTLYISEISTDRTELRLESSTISNDFLEEKTNLFTSYRETQPYFVDFLLNFGNNNLVIANNLKLDNPDTPSPSIVVKLYEPLPSNFNIKDTLWVVTTLNESEAFNVNIPLAPIQVRDTTPISSPNFNIPLKSQVNNSSQKLSYSDIISGALTGSQNQIESLLSQSAINISVDYSDFNDFIHFSSAQTRIENFYYKVSLIETYTSSSGMLSNITSSTTSKIILDKKISNVIKNFDKFEYFMYYSSGSATSFPKQNNQKPYIPYSVTSSQALTWLGSEDVSSAYFGGLIESASNFDNANPDELKKSIPEYLRESSDNQMYDLFVDMVAQYYDSVWLYTKDITQKYNADNRLDFGVSKDLVADAIKDFGVKLYQNNFSNKELYTTFLGLTPLGGTFPFPEMVNPTGSTTIISASATLYSASHEFATSTSYNDVVYLKNISTNAGSFNEFFNLTPQIYLRATNPFSAANRGIFRIQYNNDNNVGQGNAQKDAYRNGILDTSKIFNIVSGSGTAGETPAIKLYLTQSSDWRNTLFAGPTGIGTPPPYSYEMNFISGGLTPGQLPFTVGGSGTSATFTTVGSIISSSNPPSVPSGFELVNTLISASNDIIPMDDVNKSLYKRLYHNIPYLLKSKGTIAGLRALITSYGIPDTILKISEFGGKDKVNENDYDYYFNNFNYAFNTNSSNYINTNWNVSSYFRTHPDDVPGTVEFRFKTEGIPTSHQTQSLWYTKRNNGDVSKLVTLSYVGSGSSSGSYNGSIPDPYNQYGTLTYYQRPGTSKVKSSSISLPFYDGGWWSVMVRNNGFTSQVGYLGDQEALSDFIIDEDGNYIVNETTAESTYQLRNEINLIAANKIYNGNDGTKIGFVASSSFLDAAGNEAIIQWGYGDTSSFCQPYSDSSLIASNFTGDFQEIRYYNTTLGTSRFLDYTMNPLSIEGSEGETNLQIKYDEESNINNSPNDLTFRAALGSELSISSSLIQSSIHPRITGSWSLEPNLSQFENGIPSFKEGHSNYNFYQTPTFSPNTEYFFLDQPAVGIKNRITDKIKSENDSIPSGNVLSPIRSLSQYTEVSASYTDDINYLEVAFSPQNQINDDIIGQLGHFNIGNFIGDPRQRFSGSNYPDLNRLSENYFQKYTKPYDLKDFTRLIKFFDNSLFKMIKDFIPTRTSLASGLVIKQHLLERNKYPEPQMSFENKQYTGSINMVEVSGGPGGMFNDLNSPAPLISFKISSQDQKPEGFNSFSNNMLQPFSASINSTARGKLGEYFIESKGTVTTEFIKVYDGEQLFIKIGHASEEVAFVWETSKITNISYPEFKFVIFGRSVKTLNPYEMVVPSGIAGLKLGKETQFDFNSKSKNYKSPLTGISDDILKITDAYIGVNYLPLDTISKRNNNIQQWEESYSTTLGPVAKTHDNQEEFYDGEFSGSKITVTNGELNVGCSWAKNPNPRSSNFFGVRMYDSTGSVSDYIEGNFLNNANKPKPGFISLYSLVKPTSSFTPPDPGPPPPPPTNAYNTPYYFAFYRNTLANDTSTSAESYGSSFTLGPIISGSSNPNILDWNFGEDSGDRQFQKHKFTVNFSPGPLQNNAFFNSQVESGQFVYDMAFLNDELEVIQGIEITNFEVIFPNYLSGIGSNYIVHEVRNNPYISSNPNILRIETNQSFKSTHAKAFIGNNSGSDEGYPPTNIGFGTNYEKMQIQFTVTSTTTDGTLKSFNGTTDASIIPSARWRNTSKYAQSYGSSLPKIKDFTDNQGSTVDYSFANQLGLSSLPSGSDRFTTKIYYDSNNLPSTETGISIARYNQRNLFSAYYFGQLNINGTIPRAIKKSNQVVGIPTPTQVENSCIRDTEDSRGLNLVGPSSYFRENNLGMTGPLQGISGDLGYVNAYVYYRSPTSTSYTDITDNVIYYPPTTQPEQYYTLACYKDLFGFGIKTLGLPPNVPSFSTTPIAWNVNRTAFDPTLPPVTQRIYGFVNGMLSSTSTYPRGTDYYDNYFYGTFEVPVGTYIILCQIKDFGGYFGQDTLDFPTSEADSKSKSAYIGMKIVFT